MRRLAPTNQKLAANEKPAANENPAMDTPLHGHTASYRFRKRDSLIASQTSELAEYSCQEGSLNIQASWSRLDSAI